MAAGGLAAAVDRLLDGHNGGADPAGLRAALVDLYGLWLHRAATAAGVDAAEPGVALVAVGGLGRTEPVPFADLDLVLVHDGHPRVTAVAEALWYPLWDAGVGLDHSVRTPEEALRVAAEDPRTGTALLDARHLAGDPELTARLTDAARERWRRRAPTALPGLIDDARRRWERSGEVARSVRPDLKHGRGGLRDLVLLDALATAQLVDRPGAELAAARRLLLDARTELRRRSRRRRDVLDDTGADDVARALGLADRFALARRLSAAGRAVAYAVDVAVRSSVRSAPSIPPSAAPRAAPGGRVRRGGRRGRAPLADGVVRHGDEVALARDAAPARDPALLLRVAAASAGTGLPIADGTLRTLAASAPEPREPWSAGSRRALTALLGAGEGLVDVVETLERAGLWARLFPEWGAVRDLPPREPVHAWTVDRHLVRTCVEASRLTTSVARPDLLLLGALLHDLGKGRGADHSVLGAGIAGQVATRIGLSAADTRTVTRLVRHHLLLPHTATRRDIGEHATLDRVLVTLDGDVDLLDLLHALTRADALATGPGVWTDWRAALVGELVDRCRALAGGTPPPEPVPPADRRDHADRRHVATAAVRTGRGQLRITGTGGPAELVLAAPPGADLLTAAAGVLALNSVAVHTATLRPPGGPGAHDTAAVGVFTASPVFGRMPDEALLREQFARAVTGSADLQRRIAAKERAYDTADTTDTAGTPASAVPRVLWFDDEAAGDDTVVLELRAPDRIGLLHRVARALRRCAVDVRWARVDTLGTAAVDAFAIRTGRSGTGASGTDGVWRRRVANAVLEAAVGPVAPDPQAPGPPG